MSNLQDDVNAAQLSESISKKITINVPDTYTNLFPADWSTSDNAIALDLGILCVQHVKSTAEFDLTSRQLGQGDVIDVVRGLLDRKSDALVIELQAQISSHQTVLEERDNLRVQADQSAFRLDALTSQHAAEIAQLRLSFHAEIQSRCSEYNQPVEKELNATRTHLAQLMETLKQKELALTQLNEKYARLQIPAEKGNLAEAQIQVAASEYGIHSINTSKGVHNTKFHDLLLSTTPLTDNLASDGRPFYFSQHGTRLSVESKKYTKSSGLTDQIKAFSIIRTDMILMRRADCFLFVVSGTPIPGKPRFEIELAIQDGHAHLTGYLVATDVTQQEIAQVALTLLNCQSHLHTRAKLKARPESDILAELERISIAFMLDLQRLVAGADETLRTLQLATKASNDMRFNLIKTLLASHMQLVEVGVTTDNSTAVNDALASVVSGHSRLKTCPFIKNKEEYRRLALHLGTKHETAPTDDETECNRKRKADSISPNTHVLC